MKLTLGSALLVFLALFIRGEQQKKKPRVLRVGDEVHVHLIGDEARIYPGVAKVEIATDRLITLIALEGDADNPTDLDVEILRKFDEAIQAGDKNGVEQLIKRGSGFRVAERAKCLVLKRSYEKITKPRATLIGLPVVPGGVAKVRILDGPMKDSVGWLPVRNLRD